MLGCALANVTARTWSAIVRVEVALSKGLDSVEATKASLTLEAALRTATVW
jgi:hypothetical protein